MTNNPIKKIQESIGCDLTPRTPSPGVLHDVKILGLDSVNNRRYTPACVQNAVALYEGVAVHFDHDRGSSDRSFLSKFGVLRNVRFVAWDGLRGDLHYNSGHLYAPTFEGWANNYPNEIGLSHKSWVRSNPDRDGIEVVETISSVESVDIVSRPATTKGLYESIMLNEETPPATDPKVPDEADKPDEPDMGHMDHLAAMVACIFKDPKMSSKEKVAKIQKAIAMLEDDTGTSDATFTQPGEDDVDDEPVVPDVVEEDDADDKDAEESVSKKALAAFRSELDKLVTEAQNTIRRVAGVKEPVSTPAPNGKPKLTMDDFLNEMKGK